jgi:hypothetical protein
MMIDTARDLSEGGWTGGKALDWFSAYVEAVLPIIEDAQWVCTINEPDIHVLMAQVSELMDAGLNSAQLPVPDGRIGPYERTSGLLKSSGPQPKRSWVGPWPNRPS